MPLASRQGPPLRVRTGEGRCWTQRRRLALGLVSRPRDYRRGPVVLRGEQVPTTTTDQRLLDSRGATDWLHADPWRVMRIQSECVEGFGALAELGPAVSVFGSARLT